MYHGLTDVAGIQVGHWTNLEAGTGCTVVLCPEGAVAGVDVRGGAPGTRELALLDPVCMVEKVHAILLGGGSAFGLAAADGVMRWLEEHGYGFPVGVARVPIVPAAILFDLACGRADVRPDAAAGYAACVAASAGPIAEGNVGAGTGATVGKLAGYQYTSKGGLGTASKQVGRDIIVAALAVVNAAGDVIDPATQTIVAGARRPDGLGFVDCMQAVEKRLGAGAYEQADDNKNVWGGNTTLAIVATNVALSKTGATKVAQMAHDGLARSIHPVHTMIDGDVVFALSLGDKSGDPGLVGALAAEVLATAVVRAVQMAESLHGVPCVREIKLVC